MVELFNYSIFSRKTFTAKQVHFKSVNLGHMQKMDPTFIASLLSGTLASYGIQRATNGNGNGNDKPKP